MCAAGNDGLPRPGFRAGGPASVPSAQRRHQPTEHRRAIQSRPGRRGESPLGRPSRCRDRRRSRTGRRAGLAELEPAGAGSLRRSPQHRGPLQVPRRLGHAGTAGPGRAGRLPVGRRVDDPTDRPLAGEPWRRDRRRARARGGGLPFGGSRRGPRLPPHSIAAPLAAEPLRTERRPPAGGVDGRTTARGGGRCGHCPLGRLPLHGIRRAARHGGIGGPRGGAARLARRAVGHGRSALIELGRRDSSPAASSSCRSPPSTCW